MCFLHRNPQIHLEKSLKIHNKMFHPLPPKTMVFFGHFLGNQYHQGAGRVWRKAPSLEALKGRSGTSGEDNEGLIGKRGLTNSRLWGRLIVNTHLFLAVQLSIILSFCEYFWYSDFEKADLEDKELPFPWFHGTTYLLTDMLASNGSPIGPTSLKTCVVNGMVSNKKPVRY